MKYLFIVQSEGRGHLTQAIALADMLRRNGHEVSEILLGESKEREIPSFFLNNIGCPVLKFATFTFRYKKNNKGVNLFRSILYNAEIRQLKKYRKSIEFIHDRIVEQQPDAVISFYEVFSAFTFLRYKIKIPFINIGHQFLINHPDYNFAKSTKNEMMLLRLHTYVNTLGATRNLALSFYPMEDSLDEKISVVPPLLRKEVLEATPTEEDFILVYMVNSGYESEIREWHAKNPDIKLRCFWDKKDAPQKWEIDSKLTFYQLDDKKFIKYMASCKGYISTAGFESICEAFYLKKPVMMIPAHIEQEINASDAASTGYGITDTFFNIDRLLDYIKQYRKEDNHFKEWVNSGETMFLEKITNHFRKP